MHAKRFQITGIVQGVCFRMKTKQLADELELTGWAKNCTDGSVEVHAEGNVAALSGLEDWLSVGPERAEVDVVTSEDVNPERFTSFTISADAY